MFNANDNVDIIELEHDCETKQNVKSTLLPLIIMSRPLINTLCESISHPSSELISFISASRSKSKESSSTVFVLTVSAVDTAADTAAAGANDD